MKDVATSVRARLLNLSRAQTRDYNRLTLLYLQERFLARLSVSKYDRQFILKGGLYLYSRYGVAARPTRDMDLLGKGTSSDLAAIKTMVTDVLSIQLEDGVSFDAASVSTAQIKEGAEYEGVRASFTAYLGSLRQQLTLDIGFGDRVTPAPKRLGYPTLLELAGLPEPELLVYSIETVIAEKLQAMTFLGMQNSRAKDFYDLYYASKHEQLAAGQLRRALETTFRQRDTPLEDALNIFAPAFAQNDYLQTVWAAFRKNYPELDAPDAFADVIARLELFLAPLLKDEAVGQWQTERGTWEIST